MFLVTVNNVWKKFVEDGAWILAGLNLRVVEGNLVGIVGSNGSGKTTLIRIMAGLTIPTRGEVRIGGLDPRWWQAKSKIGVVLHRSMLYMGLTVRENLLFYASLYGISDYAPEDDRVVEVLGLRRVLDQRVANLSYGWRKRADIARSLLHRPPVLLFDEPFTGLDPQGVQDVMELLLEHVENGGIAIATAPKESDLPMDVFRVLRLVDGKVVEDELA